MNAASLTDPESYLKSLAEMEDRDIDLSAAALALAALDQPGISLERFHHHLKILVGDVAKRFGELIEAGAEDNCETRLAALKHIINDQHGYSGDVQTYDDLQNASLIRVIDRQKGLPITLALLYMHAARGQGWTIQGLNIPGHFVCRLEKEGQRVVFDPFAECKILGAADLRFLVKKTIGPNAELSAEYYEPVTNRDILIRLQNNLKYRMIDAEDYDGALKVIERMRMFSPEEYRLLLDAGVLYSKVNHKQAAIACLSEYIEKAPNIYDRQEAEMLLQQLQDSLN